MPLFDIKKEKDNNIQQNILRTGGITVGLSLFLSVLYPPIFIFTGTMLAAGLCGVGYYIVTWSELDELMKNLGLCNRSGAYPIGKYKKKTDNSVIHVFRLPCGMCLKDFTDKQDAISQYLGGREIEIKYTYKAIQIEVFNSKEVAEIPFEMPHVKGSVAFPVGYTRHGKLITVVLSDGEPHLLIAGATGSGKSYCLRLIATYLLLQKSVDLHMLDFKGGAEFGIFEKCNHVLSFGKNMADAARIISDLHKEVDKRLALFYEKGCVLIDDYNEISKVKMRPQIFMIDEYAEIANQKKILPELHSLTARGRAVGIHVIVGTQRASASILDGDFKCHFTNTIGLKTSDQVNAKVIGIAGLEQLRGKGHCIVKNGGKEKECQSMSLPLAKAKELIKHTYIEKNTTPPPLNLIKSSQPIKKRTIN
jgi:S-DNA-T family DNA segregation ATPase FtsK/SpoIIIE